jgi:hypothetical protein
MPSEPKSVSAESSRYSVLTLAAAGLIACVLADMVHEALGHGVASLLTGDRILHFSSVGVQNETANRFVSAAGTSANLIVGALALLLFRPVKQLTAFSYFLWLFGAFNLFNAGYFVVSAILNSGDWANVIAGLSPPLVWRSAMGVAGAALYVLSVRWVAGSLGRLADAGDITASDLPRLVWPAYIAGGVVMTAASIFNPYSPSLILLSGAGASFGLNAGLLFVPGLVGGRMADGRAAKNSSAGSAVPMSYAWVAVAIVIAAIFIAVLGPGVRFVK